VNADADRGPGERFPRADRILSRADFLRTQRDGRRVHTRHFLIMVRCEGRQRLGITVTRKTAGSVGRNRIRRLAREVFRRNRELFPAGCELVLLARAGADQLDYATLQAELTAARDALARAARSSSAGTRERTPS
jgi:ribonuclease P protein component